MPGLNLNNSHYIVQKFGQAKTGCINFHFSRFDFGKVQDFIDQIQEMLPAAFDNIKSDLLGFGQALISFENLGIPQNAVERGAEFMTHIGEEFAFGTVGNVRSFFGFFYVFPGNLQLPVFSGIRNGKPGDFSNGMRYVQIMLLMFRKCKVFHFENSHSSVQVTDPQVETVLGICP